MLEIDGSKHTGSGTIVRYAAALCSLVGETLHISRIRAGRDKPGLRPQHLLAVQACSHLTQGQVEGAAVGSREILYRPGSRLRGGNREWDIGTAGSTTMLAFTLLPMAIFSNEPCRFTLTGGIFQDFAPGYYHMSEVLMPQLLRMGADARLTMLRAGYVPKGRGRLVLETRPHNNPLSPITMAQRGAVRRFFGTALASHLKQQKVGERLADRSRMILSDAGYEADIEVVYDDQAIQKGAALFLCAQTVDSLFIGMDGAGKPGRPSESIADYVGSALLEDLGSGATTDRFLADQLILFAALADGLSTYRIPRLTEHVRTNLWLVEEILGAKTSLSGQEVQIRGVGYQ